MSDAEYRLSFTTGGLLLAEAVAVAEVAASTSDWAEARHRAQTANLVQQRTATSVTRVTREVLQRLAELPSSGVEIVAHGSTDEARHLLWLAACLRYRFLRDFGREVLRERYLAGTANLSYENFDTFWNIQSSWVDALRDTADSTRAKLRQNTFRMLREAQILGEDGYIHPVLLSPRVAETVVHADADLLFSFPMEQAQIPARATGKV